MKPKEKYLVERYVMDLRKVHNLSIRVPSNAVKITGVASFCNVSQEYYQTGLTSIGEVSICLNREIASFFRFPIAFDDNSINEGLELQKNFQLEFLEIPIEIGDQIQGFVSDHLYKEYQCFPDKFVLTNPPFCPNPNYSVFVVIRYEEGIKTVKTC